MKRLLLLGGGHAEIPLIQAAQALGYYVITTGNAREGLGHPYADKNVFADFSDKDAMLELARSENVDAVCSGCNDFALLSTAYVCEKLGLPGHDSFETALQIHHKDKYRALAEKLGIATPRAVTVKNQEEFEALLSENSAWIASPSARNDVQNNDHFSPMHGNDKEFAANVIARNVVTKQSNRLTFPIIVKPVDLTGGKGILRANNLEEAIAAYKNACSRTREDHIVVEEFVEGSNHGFSAFLIGGKVAFWFADNEQYFLNKYMVSGANTPSTTAPAGIAQLVRDSEKLAAHLHLVDGILHIQYIERPDGTPVIIEICRRAPGDLYIKFVKYATGVDYPKMIVSAETGATVCKSEIAGSSGPEKNCSGPETNCGGPAARVKPFLRHCIMAEREGTVHDVVFTPEIQKNIVEKFLWFKAGEKTGDPLYYKAGIVFLQFDSIAEMAEKTAKMTNYIRIEMSDTN